MIRKAETIDVDGVIDLLGNKNACVVGETIETGIGFVRSIATSFDEAAIRSTGVCAVDPTVGYFSELSPADNLLLGVPFRQRFGRRIPDDQLTQLGNRFGLTADELLDPHRDNALLICLLRAVQQRPSLLCVACDIDGLSPTALDGFLSFVAERGRSGLVTIFPTRLRSAAFGRTPQVVLVRNGEPVFAGPPSSLPRRRAHLLLSESAEDRRHMAFEELQFEVASARDVADLTARIADFLIDVVGPRSIVLVIRNPPNQPTMVVRPAAKRSAYEHDRIRRFAQFLSDATSRAAGASTAPPETPTEFRPDHVPHTVHDLMWGEAILGRLAIFDDDDSTIATDISALVPQISRLVHEYVDAVRAQQTARFVAKAESLADLVGGIAHDFNNSLQSILGSIDLIRAKGVGDEIAPDVELLRTIAVGAQSFVAKLLAVSRTEDRQSTFVDCHQILDEALEIVSRGADMANISVTTSYAAQDFQLMGDANELRNVFINLLLNSVQAIRRPVGLISISTVNTFEPKSAGGPSERNAVPSTIKITVADNGTGISPDIREEMFLPFVTSRRGSTGTGLGLAVAHATLAEHGGSIAVSETSAEGTSMMIELPLTPLTSDTFEPESSPSVSTDLVKGARILLCDDDETVRTILEEMLRSLGAVVHVTNTGMACVNLYLERMSEIDIIIVDQVMPEVSGDRVIALIRAVDKSVPIVWLSGYRATEIEMDHVSRDATVKLTKPVGLNELGETLGALMRQHIL